MLVHARPLSEGMRLDPYELTRKVRFSSDLRLIVEGLVEDGFEQAAAFALGGGELRFQPVT